MTARNGERPSSEFTADEICYARALDWLRVEDSGLGYVSREGVAAILKIRANQICSAVGRPGPTPLNRVFEEAFALGLVAANDADRARAEIQSVLDEIGPAIGASLKMDLKVTIARLERPVFTGILTEEEDLTSPGTEKLRVDKEAGQTLFLCDFVRAPGGYPVDIEYADIIASCDDKESLVQTLAEMLKHPSVARMLRAFA